MRGLAWAVSIAVGFVAEAAQAEIVHHVNPAPGEPGHYDWRWPGYTSLPPSWLDITRSPAGQLDVQTGSSVAQHGGSPGHWFTFNETNGGAAVAVDHHPYYTGWFTRPQAPGEALDGLGYSASARHYYEGLEHIEDPPSLLPDGMRCYLGVRTDDGRFGWIEIERDGVRLRALSWAYETEPGLAIFAGQVPAPGAAMLVGAGVLRAASRRRRP
ncbi:MAG: hypothetical protein IT436_04085 [Phycisphaerales bacterium]|nr:hypothetical protein [Phycisphaerales bacterium]